MLGLDCARPAGLPAADSWQRLLAGVTRVVEWWVAWAHSQVLGGGRSKRIGRVQRSYQLACSTRGQALCCSYRYHCVRYFLVTHLSKLCAGKGSSPMICCSLWARSAQESSGRNPKMLVWYCMSQ